MLKKTPFLDADAASFAISVVFFVSLYFYNNGNDNATLKVLIEASFSFVIFIAISLFFGLRSKLNNITAKVNKIEKELNQEFGENINKYKTLAKSFNEIDDELIKNVGNSALVNSIDGFDIKKENIAFMGQNLARISYQQFWTSMLEIIKKNRRKKKYHAYMTHATGLELFTDTYNDLAFSQSEFVSKHNGKIYRIFIDLESDFTYLNKYAIKLNKYLDIINELHKQGIICAYFNVQYMNKNNNRQISLEELDDYCYIKEHDYNLEWDIDKNGKILCFKLGKNKSQRIKLDKKWKFICDEVKTNYYDYNSISESLHDENTKSKLVDYFNKINEVNNNFIKNLESNSGNE